MALRNISFCLRYSNRGSPYRIHNILKSSACFYRSVNNHILNSETECIKYKTIVHTEFPKIISCYHPVINFTRSLSIDVPKKISTINDQKDPSQASPPKPDEIAKVIKEVHDTALKSSKSLPYDTQKENESVIKNKSGGIDPNHRKMEAAKTMNANQTSELASQQKPETKFAILYDKAKKIALHNWYALRLFFLETKVTGGILINIVRGKTLTRRERKQLVRTVADLCRLIPFAVFVLVPFLELLLPLYIKFFPFMMPSTFKDKSKEAEQMHQLLKGKLEMAKFLQDTLDETINAGKYKSDGNLSLETFNHFMKEVRESGHTANTSDILKFSRLFEDEVTLESLDHKQVKALCKLLDINSIGPKPLLNFHLRMKVHQLQVYDKMIVREGVGQIPTYELQQLCRERGMRAMGLSEERLRFQLQQWLKMSIENEVPISLLLLSRTMYLPESLSAEEQLTKTILHLPESVTKEASLLTSSATAKFDNKTMFEVIKEEDIAIRQEKQAETQRIKKETFVDKAPLITMETGDQSAMGRIITQDESISASDLAHLETAIESISGSQTSLQEEELEELKEETAELTESMVSVAGANNLGKKLQAMIKDMDSLLDKLDVEKEKLRQSVDSELKVPNEEERMIAIEDLMKTLKQVKSMSHDEGKWRRILEMLDEDHDGHIEVHHIMEVMEMVGSDDIKLSGKELERVLDAIDKEEVIEKEEEKEEETRKEASERC